MTDRRTQEIAELKEQVETLRRVNDILYRDRDARRQLLSVAEPEPPRLARLVTVIEAVGIRGKGIDGDPVREVRQLWTLDGRLLAERDSHRDHGTWEPLERIR